MSFERLRDEHLDMLYSVAQKYGLDEEHLGDLTIVYCETIQRFLEDGQEDLRHRLYVALSRAADHMVEEAEKVEDTIPIQDMCYTMDMDNTILRGVLEELLNTLHPRQQQVLYMRFFEGYTLAECGESIGCSRERVRQLEQKGLRKLRQPRNAKRLRGFCDVGLPKSYYYKYTKPEEYSVEAPFDPYEHMKMAYVPRVSYPFHETVLVDHDRYEFLSIEDNVFHLVPHMEGHVVEVLVNGEKWYLSGINLTLVQLDQATIYKTPLAIDVLMDYLERKYPGSTIWRNV